MSTTETTLYTWTCCCGSTQVWAPTFCNHGHCAECFEACDPDHDGCGWDGREHESYFPLNHGNVWNAACETCQTMNQDDDGAGACDACQD